MLLAMDIGNTNVKIGIFKGDELVSTWRVSTVASHTADEYGMVIYDLLRQGGHSFEDVDERRAEERFKARHPRPKN